MRIQSLSAQCRWMVAAIVAVAPLTVGADEPASGSTESGSVGVIRISDKKVEQTSHTSGHVHHHGAEGCPSCQNGCPDCPEGYQQIGHGVKLTGCMPADAAKMGILHIKMFCTKHHLTMKAHCRGQHEECYNGPCKTCGKRHACGDGTHQCEQCKREQGNGRTGRRSDSYSVVYAVNPAYSDARDSKVYAAEGYGVPMAVPLAPVVGHTYNYGWGIPSSRRTPVSRFVPDVRYIQRTRP